MIEDVIEAGRDGERALEQLASESESPFPAAMRGALQTMFDLATGITEEDKERKAEEIASYAHNIFPGVTHVSSEDDDVQSCVETVQEQADDIYKAVKRIKAES